MVYTGTDDYYSLSRHLAISTFGERVLSCCSIRPHAEILKTTHSKCIQAETFPLAGRLAARTSTNRFEYGKSGPSFPTAPTEVMPTAAALRRAQELGLDLVLVSPTAVPPVAKAVDYGHYQYEQKKKQHDAQKKQHVVQVKELKFRPNTDDHDYDFKKNHAIRFLKEGNRVKAVVQFRGREIAHADPR